MVRTVVAALALFLLLVPSVAASDGSVTWTPASPMPSKRASPIAATSSNGRIYVIGGYVSAAGSNGQTAVSNLVEELDPATGVWRSMRPNPFGHDYLRAVAADNGRIYALADPGAGIPEDPTPGLLFDEYDPATDSWRRLEGPSQDFYFASLVGGRDAKLYLVGGWDESSSSATRFEEYDIASGRWRPRAPVPRPRYGAAAFARTGGGVHVVGGVDPESWQTVAVADEYDPKTSRWRTTPSTMDIAFGSPQVFAAPGEAVYIFDTDGPWHDWLGLYEPGSDRLTHVPFGLPSREGVAYAISGSKLFAFGDGDWNTPATGRVDAGTIPTDLEPRPVTPSPTVTTVVTRTATPTRTIAPTRTPTAIRTATTTRTSTPTRTSTAQRTVFPTSTSTPSRTPTPTRTPTRTWTSTAVPQATSATRTSLEPTATRTPTQTRTATSTRTWTPTRTSTVVASERTPTSTQAVPTASSRGEATRAAAAATTSARSTAVASASAVLATRAALQRKGTPPGDVEGSTPTPTVAASRTTGGSGGAVATASARRTALASATAVMATRVAELTATAQARRGGDDGSSPGPTSAAGHGDPSPTVVATPARRDRYRPTIVFQGNRVGYDLDDVVEIACVASDRDSGVTASTCQDAVGPAYTFGFGTVTLKAAATDLAGNAGTGRTTFFVRATYESLCGVVANMIGSGSLGGSLCSKLTAADQASRRRDRALSQRHLQSFAADVMDQRGRTLTDEQVTRLVTYARALQ